MADYLFMYMSKMSDELAIYSDQKTLKRSAYFHINGSSFRNAYVSYYYYHLLKSNELFQFYCDIHENKVRELYVFSSDIEAHIAEQFKIRYDVRSVRLKINRIRAYFYSIKKTVQITIYQFISRSFAKKTTCRSDILFYVNHDKFVAYLQPLLEKMQNSFAFIRPFNRNSLSLIQKCQYPMIDGYAFPKITDSSPQLPIMVGKFYDYLNTILCEVKPKKLIVVEGNSYEDRVIEMLCSSHGIETICIQYGWFLNQKIASIRSYAYSKILIWGDYFRASFPHVNQNTSLIPTGSLSVQLQPESRPITRSVAFFLNGNDYVYKKLNDSFVRVLLKVLDKNLDHEIIVREHPSFPMDAGLFKTLSEHPKCRIMSPQKYSLEDVFQSVDVLVSCPSTTILEAFAYGVIPIVFNPAKELNQSMPFMEISSESELMDRMNALFENYDHFCRTHHVNKTEINHYFLYSQEVAIQKIMDEILK